MGFFDRFKVDHDKLAEAILRQSKSTPRLTPSRSKATPKPKSIPSKKYWESLPIRMRGRAIKGFVEGKTTDQIKQDLQEFDGNSKVWHNSAEDVKKMINFFKKHRTNGEPFKTPLGERRRRKSKETIADSLQDVKSKHLKNEKDSVCKRYQGECVACYGESSIWVKAQRGTLSQRLENGHTLFSNFSHRISAGNQLGADELRNQILLQQPRKDDSWGLDDPSPRGQLIRTSNSMKEKEKLIIEAKEKACMSIEELDVQTLRKLLKKDDST
tara:strand:+ start:937 stop:1746 length:810 start_codon:yes stop_codon:yes gene_type:complete